MYEDKEGDKADKSDNRIYGQCYHRIFNEEEGSGYLYFEADTDDLVIDPATLKLLGRIKVPPTYSRVVLCPDPRNNLVGQAVDGQGKLQYFYSEKYRERAAREKNCNLIHFGHNVDEIMSNVADILEDYDYDKEAREGSRNNANPQKIKESLVLHALALRIMTLCHFRPGSSRSIRQNGTYGLTTIGPEHVDWSANGNAARITFEGKKNQVNSCVIQDPLTVNFLKALNKHKAKLGNKHSRAKLLELPGDGPSVTPESLNEFLQNYHPSITTKTWRTWFANISYIENLLRIGVIPQTIRARKILSNRVIKTIAEELHHTMAVNKRNYLIPELEALFVRDPEHWIEMSIIHSDAQSFLMAFLMNYCSGPDSQ